MTNVKPYEVLQSENDMLRRRVTELENRARRGDPTAAAVDPVAPVNSNLMKLIQQKDKTLQERAAELEIRARELENMVTELNQKNQAVSDHLRAVALYKTIVENEPAAIVGIDPGLMVMLFNQGAVNLIGARVQGAIFSPVETLRLQEFCPGIDAMIQSVLSRQQMREEEFRAADGKTYYTMVYPLMDGEQLLGTIIRVSR